MRNIPSYTWEDVLNEYVPQTIIGLELLYQEKEMERKAMEKARRKGRRK